MPSKNTLPDSLFIFTLFFYFLSYPFILRNMMGMVYPLTLNALLVITVAVCITVNAKIVCRNFHRTNPILMGAVYLYVFYFMVLMVVSLFHSTETAVAISAIYELREFIFILFVFLFFSNKGILVFLRAYVELFTWCSVLGLLLVFLNYMNLISPIAELYLDNLPGGVESKRLFYGIGFIWPDIWLGSPLGLERLQSFSDEAGTFGFAVLPAIFLARYWRMKLREWIMVIALIFTFSIGAISIWLFTSIISFVVNISRNGVKKRHIVFLFLFVIAGMLIVNYVSWDVVIQAERYFSAKYVADSGTETSLGQRFAGINIALDAIRDHPLGFGANSAGLALNLGDASLAVGWLIPLVEAGVLGFSLYILAFGVILGHALREAILGNGIKRICAIVVIVNGYAAFQRAGIDANMWHLFWLTSYLRVIGMDAMFLKAWHLNDKWRDLAPRLFDVLKRERRVS